MAPVRVTMTAAAAKGVCTQGSLCQFPVMDRSGGNSTWTEKPYDRRLPLLARLAAEVGEQVVVIRNVGSKRPVRGCDHGLNWGQRGCGMSGVAGEPIVRPRI
jgi:hypothetical protein